MRKIFRAKQQYFSNLDPNLAAENKKFWKTVKPLFSDKTSQKDLEIAKTFNNYFNNIVQTLCNQVGRNFH